MGECSHNCDDCEKRRSGACNGEKVDLSVAANPKSKIKKVVAEKVAKKATTKKAAAKTAGTKKTATKAVSAKVAAPKVADKADENNAETK